VRCYIGLVEVTLVLNGGELGTFNLLCLGLCRFRFVYFKYGV
jgi:hypothetical protein